MSIVNSNNFLHKTVDDVKQFFSPLVNAATVVRKDGTRLEQDGKVYADSTMDSAKLGGKDPKYYIQPRNLLDNSDFTNPVNQRGGNKATISWEYFIDRWLVAGVDGSGAYYDINKEIGGVGFSVSTGANVWLIQRIDEKMLDENKTYTVAYETAYGEKTATGYVFDKEGSYYKITLTLPSGTYLKWAALYEGEYTADNLPPYVPKGYAVELAECQRYYISNIGGGVSGCFLNGVNKFRAFIATPVTMRDESKPTAILTTADNVVVNYNGVASIINTTGVETVLSLPNGVIVDFSTGGNPGAYAQGVAYGTRIALDNNL